MKRLEEMTLSLKEKGRKAFMPFFTAFYPSEKKFLELLFQAKSAGADLIEIGIPFTDPVADGLFIQYSSDWVLRKGFKITRFISVLGEIKKELEIPLIIISYLNPIYRFGFERFAEIMEKMGIEGILFPDLPAEESFILGDAFSSRNISCIFMVSPSTKEERAKSIAKKSSGFIYFVTHYGVTGSKMQVGNEMKGAIRILRKVTEKPIYAGFGISSPKDVFAIEKEIDGIIVGSAIVKIIMGREEQFPLKEIENFLKSMREAI